MHFIETEDINEEGVLVPKKREGAVSYLVDDKMMVYGGCDYQNNVCYNDVFALDIDRHPCQWSRINLVP